MSIRKTPGEINEKSVMRRYNYYLSCIQDRLGSNPTTSSQLDRLGKYLFNNKWKGCYARNETNYDTPGYYIVNLDKRGMPGSHWIGVVVDKSRGNTKSLVYDSFGRNNQQVLGIGGKGVTYTDPDKEQGYLEEDCGQRSLSFLCVYDTLGWKAAALL